MAGAEGILEVDEDEVDRMVKIIIAINQESHTPTGVFAAKHSLPNFTSTALCHNWTTNLLVIMSAIPIRF